MASNAETENTCTRLIRKSNLVGSVVAAYVITFAWDVLDFPIMCVVIDRTTVNRNGKWTFDHVRADRSMENDTT